MKNFDLPHPSNSLNYPDNFPAEVRVFNFCSRELKFLVPAPDAIRSFYQAHQQQGGTMEFPYWSKLWPAALGMCRYLEKHPDVVKEQKVLELAAGLGLPSLVAATFSKDVSCSDYIPEAVGWAQKSAQLNNLFHIRHFVVDWNCLPPDLKCDTLLLSDVNYAQESFAVLKQVLLRFLNSGTTIILSTPQRLMAKPFIEELLPWCRHSETFDIYLDGQDTSVSVFKLAT